MSANMASTVRNQPKRQKTNIWDKDIKQIVALFQEIFQAGEVVTDPVEYVAAYRRAIQAAGTQLTFLQLATLDKSSPIGWKPTPLLVEFIEYRKVQKSKRLYKDNMWWQYLNDYVYGYRSDRSESNEFTYELLVAVGLMQEEEDAFCDGWITEDLHNLFDNGYFAMRNRDGLPFLAIP